MAARDFTLMLLYLTSWPQERRRCAWKGYEFAILDDLQHEGYVRANRGSRRVWLTQEGQDEAARLLAAYGLDEEVERVRRAVDRRPGRGEPAEE